MDICECRVKFATENMTVCQKRQCQLQLQSLNPKKFACLCTYTTYCRGEKCVGSKRRKAKPEASPVSEYMKTLKGLKVSLCESKELQSVPMTLVWVQMQVHHKNLSNMSCLTEVKCTFYISLWQKSLKMIIFLVVDVVGLYIAEWSCCV